MLGNTSVCVPWNRWLALALLTPVAAGVWASPRAWLIPSEIHLERGKGPGIGLPTARKDERRLYFTVWVTDAPQGAQVQIRLKGQGAPGEVVEGRVAQDGEYVCAGVRLDNRDMVDGYELDPNCSLDGEDLRPGPYELELWLSGEVLTRQAIRLLETMNFDNKRVLAVDPSTRTAGAYLHPTGFVWWRPSAPKANPPQVTVAWFREGRFVTAETAQLPKPPVDEPYLSTTLKKGVTPVISKRPFEKVDGRWTGTGSWTVVALENGQKLLGAWRFAETITPAPTPKDAHAEVRTFSGIEFGRTGGEYGPLSTLSPSEVPEKMLARAMKAAK